MKNSHSVLVAIKNAQFKNGTSKKGTTYNMMVLKGVATDDSPFKTNLDVDVSIFLRNGETPNLPPVGDILHVDIDNLEINKRSVSVTGQIIR